MTDTDFNQMDNCIAFGLNKGRILLYRAHDPTITINKFRLELLESFNCMENPHGENLDSSPDLKAVSSKLYSFKPNVVSLRFSKNNVGIYTYVVESLQYVYVRDYRNKQTLKQFSLASFPIQIKFDTRNDKFLIPIESTALPRMPLITMSFLELFFDLEDRWNGDCAF